MELIESKKSSFGGIWNQIIELSRPTAYFSSFDLAFLAIKTLGDCYMEFKDLLEAYKSYRSLKILCEDFEKYREKLFVYE